MHLLYRLSYVASYVRAFPGEPRRTRTCDLRGNSALFFQLNYAGSIPDQAEPSRGPLLNFVGYPVFNGPANFASPRDRQARSFRPRERKYTQSERKVNKK